MTKTVFPLVWLPTPSFHFQIQLKWLTEMEYLVLSSLADQLKISFRSTTAIKSK